MEVRTLLLPRTGSCPACLVESWGSPERQLLMGLWRQIWCPQELCIFQSLTEKLKIAPEAEERGKWSPVDCPPVFSAFIALSLEITAQRLLCSGICRAALLAQGWAMWPSVLIQRHWGPWLALHTWVSEDSYFLGFVLCIRPLLFSNLPFI